MMVKLELMTSSIYVSMSVCARDDDVKCKILPGYPSADAIDFRRWSASLGRTPVMSHPLLGLMVHDPSSSTRLLIFMPVTIDGLAGGV